MSKKNIVCFVFLFMITFCHSIYAQLVGINPTKTVQTNYSDGNLNDNIYIWTSNELGKQQAHLKAIPKTTTGPFIFDWFYHNEQTASWTLFKTETGMSSSVQNLPTDGYRVHVKNTKGEILEYYSAWVWNMNIETNAEAELINCSDVAFNANVNAETSFVYYNLPPAESLITKDTEITIEFSAKHTYVSDLAFYLIGPKSVGSPRILLSPNPGSISIYNDICNSGNDVTALTFSNTSNQVLDICRAQTPLSGTYGAYELNGKRYEIDWSSLLGVNAAEGDWSVQIYDCIRMDTGYLQNAKITFSNLKTIDGVTEITYNSSEIRSAINDMSCSAETASIFKVPPHKKFLQPIEITMDVLANWQHNNQHIADANETITNLTAGNHNFVFNTEVMFRDEVFYSFKKEFNFEISNEAPIINTNFCFTEPKTIADVLFGEQGLKFYTSLTSTEPLPISTLLQNKTYYVSKVDNGCESKRVEITIGFLSSFSFSDYKTQNVFSGQEINIEFPYSETEGLIYHWKVVSDNVLGSENGTGSGIKNALQLASGNSGKVTYYVTPFLNGCAGKTFMIPVQVIEMPKVIASINSDMICSGEEVTINLTGNFDNVRFKWEVLVNEVEGATEGNGNVILNTLYTNSEQGFVIYKITPFYNEIEGDAVEVEVFVNPLPKLEITNGNLCYDAKSGKIITPYILDTGFNDKHAVFEWFYNGKLLQNETKSLLKVYEPGEYMVKATNALGCISTKKVSVTANQSVISATYSLGNYFQDSQTITVNVKGDGNYLYQLNDSPPQKSPVFNYVVPGVHKVIITDEFSCAYVVLENIVTVHYPNFFTPNGDGINDYWNIWSLKDVNDAEIFIYDRYGKLIKRITPNSEGWDGSLHGMQAPSTDYWFVVNYTENNQSKSFKSHFSLKR